jgi:hypothetical protein
LKPWSILSKYFKKKSPLKGELWNCDLKPQEPEENLFDARGKPCKQEWPNAKPKTERQPPATDADTNDIFKHSAIPRDRIERCKGCRKKILPEGCVLAGGEGGDFFTSRRSEPLRLSIPHARNFVLCLSMINTQLYES